MYVNVIISSELRLINTIFSMEYDYFVNVVSFKTRTILLCSICEIQKLRALNSINRILINIL